MNVRTDGRSDCITCGKPAFVGVSGHPSLYCSERCRKAKYMGRCVDCGGVCNVDGRRTNPNLRCRACEAPRALRALDGPRVSNRSTLRWTDADMIAAVRRAAARFGEPLSCKAYQSAAHAAGWPSIATVTYRLGGGSWASACDIAGVRSVRGRPVPSKLTVGSDDALTAVVLVTRALGYAPSALAYDAWREVHSDLGLPSLPQIRWRFGGSWLKARRAAQARVDGEAKAAA